MVIVSRIIVLLNLLYCCCTWCPHGCPSTR